jgi:hypothetical protein
MASTESSASAHPSRPEVAVGDPFIAGALHKREQGQHRHCFYCLEGWVFLGSLDHDGEEVYEAIRCRRCSGTDRINR